MKILFCVLFFFGAGLSAAHGQYLSSKDSDPEALRLLTNAGSAFTSGNAEIRFKLKVIYPGEPAATSDGVLYQHGKSYHLSLNEYAIFSDGKTRWVYLREANEINIYNESNGQDWISPQDFLRLHTSPDLVFMHAGQKGDGITVVEAKPLKGRFDSYSKFSVGIKNGALHYIHALSSDGIRQELNILSIAHPAQLDTKKLFAFNPSLYPGVHVEDLRLD